MSHAITFMVADDDVRVATAATRILRKAYRVAPPVLSLELLVRALERHRPQVLLLDVMWGPVCVLARLGALVLAHPDIRICMFSGYPVPRFVVDAVAAGATGFFVKPADANELLIAAAAMAAGKRYFAQELQTLVCVEGNDPGVHQRPDLFELGSPGYVIATAWLGFDLHLTPRQAETALGIRDGHLEKQIAGRLGCALTTVRKHVRDIYARLRTSGVVNHGSLARVVEQSLQRRPKEWRRPIE